MGEAEIMLSKGHSGSHSVWGYPNEPSEVLIQIKQTNKNSRKCFLRIHMNFKTSLSVSKPASKQIIFKRDGSSMADNLCTMYIILASTYNIRP